MASQPQQSAASNPNSTVFHTASREGRLAVENLLKQRGESLDWIDDLRHLQGKFLAKSSQKEGHACSAGCSACCLATQVDVTGIEAIAVGEYLRTCLDKVALAEVKRRLSRITERRFAQFRGIAPQSPLACAMLGKDGHCQVYPVRPIICSGVFSLNQIACHEAEQNAEQGNFSSSIPLDREAIQATGGISGSLQRVLVEKGLDGNLYELNSAVLATLETANPLDQFLAGKDLFACAICTEAHSPPRKRIVSRPNFLKQRHSKSA